MFDGQVALGEIVTTHGIDGWLKLNPYNFESPLFSAPRQVTLEKDGTRVAVELESTRRHRRQILVKLRGIDNIDGARQWIGSILSVKEAELESPAPGEYYHYRVIGLEVFDVSGARIGIITQIWSTAGTELYVVAGADKEHLIPAVKDFIISVNFEAGQMIVNPPTGLLDL